jgi:hypothetical protein
VPLIRDSIIIIRLGFAILHIWFVIRLLSLGWGLLLYYFTPLVRVLFINVGSGFFIKNLNFNFLRQILYCLLGLKACWLRFAS